MTETTMQRISTRDDPEGAAAAAARILQQASDTPISKIEPPPAGDVLLPAGMEIEGNIYTRAEVRELTGADEEALEKARMSNSLGRFLATLLNRGVVSIGGQDATPEMLRSLLIGDREALLVGIRKATYGSEVDGITANCSGCGEAVEITIDLDDSLETLLLDSERKLTVQLRRGRQAVVRLPNGSDQEAVLEDPDRTVAEQNTILLRRCLISLDDMPIIGDPTVALKLGVVDRKKIIEALMAVKCGPKLGDIKVTHEDCGEVMPVPLTIMDLFRG